MRHSNAPATTLRSRRLALLVLAAAGAAALLGAGAASPALAAEPEVPVTISFVEPTAVSIEYGQPWSVTLDGTPRVPCAQPCDPMFVIAEAGGTVLGETRVSDYWVPYPAVFPSYAATAPLHAGEHVLTASLDENFHGTHFTGASTNTARIVVAPAALALDLRVEADPVAADQAVVTGRLTGRFVDDLIPAPWASPLDAQLPAGTWLLTVADANGAEAFRKEIPVEAGGLPMVSALWQGVPAGATFTGSAAFTPSGDTAADFTITGAEGVSFTSAAATPAAPTPVDEEAEPAPAAEPVADTVPLWSLLLLGFLGLAAVGGLVASFLRLRRPRPEFETEAPAPAAPLPARAAAGWANTPSVTPPSVIPSSVTPPSVTPSPPTPPRSGRLPGSEQPPTEPTPVLQGGRRG